MYLIDSPSEIVRHAPPSALQDSAQRISAHSAQVRVCRGEPRKHEIATRLTDLGPIEQLPNMAGFGKDRRFNAGLQWRMLGRTGWAVIWRSERGPAPLAPRGALSRGDPVIGGGLKGGLKGESWGVVSGG